MKSMMYKLAGCMVMTAWALGSISCANEEVITEVAESQGKQWTITATQGSGATTKLGYTDEGTDGVAVTWVKDDVFTVFGATGSGENFTLDDNDAGNKSGNFTGTKPAGAEPYQAFFPKTTAASYNDCVMNLTGQEQTGNGAMTHLSKYDYMTGAVTLDASDNPTVNFEHQMLMMKFVLTFPNALDNDETLGVLSVSAVKAGDTTPLHLMKGVYGTGNDYKSDTQELILKNVTNETLDNLTLTAYMMMYPFELAENDKLIFKVLGNQHIYSATATIGKGGKKYTNGYRYTATPTTLVASSIPIETALIPSGTFQMGTVGNTGNELQHSVTLTSSFYMSKYQITNAQYAAFLNAKGVVYETGISNSYISGNGGKCTLGDYSGQIMILIHSWGVTHDGSVWKAQTGYENYPVVNITWYGAKAYADWVGGSLPTEAQWEYACRAGSTADYGMGYNNVPITSDNLSYYGWYATNSSSQTHPVGEKLSNLWGLYDMHGNVWEWCSDWYGSSYYSNSSAGTNPLGPATGDNGYRVLRGGSWGNVAGSCRSAYRAKFKPDLANYSFGFRVLLFP